MNEEQQTECYPLDDIAIEQIAEYDGREAQLIEQANKALEHLNTARIATLNYFTKIHKLQGNWKLADNKRELIKDTSPVVQPQAQ